MVVDQTGLATLCDLLSSPYSETLTEQQQAEVQSLIMAARRGEQIGQQLIDLAGRLGIRLDVGDLRGADPSQWAQHRTMIEEYRCPTRECGRRWARRAGHSIPSCRINKQSLTKSAP